MDVNIFMQQIKKLYSKNGETKDVFKNDELCD